MPGIFSTEKGKFTHQQINLLASLLFSNPMEKFQKKNQCCGTSCQGQGGKEEWKEENAIILLLVSIEGLHKCWSKMDNPERKKEMKKERSCKVGEKGLRQHELLSSNFPLFMSPNFRTFCRTFQTIRRSNKVHEEGESTTSYPLKCLGQSVADIAMK